MRARANTVSGGVALTDQVVEVLRDRIPYILFGTVFLFIGLCVCGIAVMRHRSGGKFFTWLGIWSAIEGTEYLFGSLAALGLLPNWLLASLPYVGNVLSFSVVVIALLAFLNLSQDKLRIFLQGAIVAGLAIAVAGVALFLFTGSSFRIMPYNHLLAAISLTVLAIVVAVPKLSRRFLVLPNRSCPFFRHPSFRFGGGLWQLVASTGTPGSARDPGPAGVCCPPILLWICCRAEPGDELVTIRKVLKAWSACEVSCG